MKRVVMLRDYVCPSGCRYKRGLTFRPGDALADVMIKEGVAYDETAGPPEVEPTERPLILAVPKGKSAHVLGRDGKPSNIEEASKGRAAHVLGRDGKPSKGKKEVTDAKD